MPYLYSEARNAITLVEGKQENESKVLAQEYLHSISVVPSYQNTKAIQAGVLASQDTE
jgi:hypothetical protein